MAIVQKVMYTVTALSVTDGLECDRAVDSVCVVCVCVVTVDMRIVP